MQSTWWMVFSLAGASMLAAILFLTLWLRARTALRILAIKLHESERTDAMFEEFRAHTVLAAKSAALEAGQQLSSKLLDDHKRENEAAREMHGKATKNITESLTEQVTKIGERLATVHDSQDKQRTALETVWRSLTTPIGAGKVAEIGLENLLKSFGLEAGKDFQTQFSIKKEGAAMLRPDVAVFMPYGRVMVIDAKASKHLMDVASAPDKQDADAARAQLKVTMNQHLKDLTSKDYRAALIDMYKEQGRSDEISTVWSVMYVPSEMAIEHMHQADPELADKLYKADIILASRGTLHGLLSLARLSVENERQVENSVHIVEDTQKLLDGIAGAFGHVSKLGDSLKKTMDSFNSFAGSSNKFILGRARKLEPYGITPSRGKSLPAPIARYDVVTNKADVVELELVETS